LTGKVAALLIVACATTAVVGCSKKQDDAKAKAEKADVDKKRPQGDRYADGQRLAASLKDWTKRWSDTADLPTCEVLLKDAAELELCKNAITALATMKAAAAKPEPETVLIHDAAELAYATEAASEKLRNASMEKMQAERAAAPGASGSAAPGKAPPPKPVFSALPKVKPLGSATKPLLGADKLKAPVETAALDPAMQVMQAFSRANRASLRYLSQFLQFGPLPTRKATFNELEGLSKRREAWPALGRTLREAAMAENDPDLQGKLKALAPKLSRRGPGMMPITPGMMPQGMPPGHPAMPQAGGDAPPAAPAKDE
jgi:hypothetical protein